MDAVALAELRGIREELVRLRVQQARVMAALLAMVRPMPAEAADRLERRLLATDIQTDVFPRPEAEVLGISDGA